MSTHQHKNRKASLWASLLLLAFTTLSASCGAGISALPVSASHDGAVSADARMLPLGSPLPGLPAEQGTAAVAKASSAILDYPGSVFLNAAGGTIDGDTLILQSSVEEPAWALYKADGLLDLKVEAFGVETIPGDLESMYSVGLSNFSDGQWHYFINTTLPEVNIDLSNNTRRLVSRLGNLYWVVVVSGGKSVRVVQGHVFTAAGDGGWCPEQGGGLFVSKGLPDMIRAEWGVRSGAGSYELWRKLEDGDERGGSQGGGNPADEWVLVAQTTETSYNDIDVLPSTWYKYKVRGVNPAGPGGFSRHEYGYMGAAPGWPGGGGEDEREVKGKIVSLTVDRITLDTQDSFLLTANTQWFLDDGTPAGPDDFAAGDNVKVHGYHNGEQWVAIKIRMEDEDGGPEYFDAKSIIVIREAGALTLENGMAFLYNENTIWKDAQGSPLGIEAFQPGVAVKVWGVSAGDGPAYAIKVMLQPEQTGEQEVLGKITQISPDRIFLNDGTSYLYTPNTIFMWANGELAGPEDFQAGDPVVIHYYAQPASNVAVKVKHQQS